MAIKWKSIISETLKYTRTAFYFPLQKVKKIHVYILLSLLFCASLICLLYIMYIKICERNHFKMRDSQNKSTIIENECIANNHTILVCIITKDLSFNLFRTIHDLFYNARSHERLQICICLHETERIRIMKRENLTAFDQIDTLTPFKSHRTTNIKQDQNIEQQFENMNYFKQCESILDQHFYKRFQLYLWMRSVPFSCFENKIKILDQGFYNTHQARTIAQETAYTDQTFIVHCYSGFRPVLCWDKICIDQWFSLCLQTDYTIHKNEKTSENDNNNYKHILTYQPDIKRYSEKFRKDRVKNTLNNVARTIMQMPLNERYEDSSFACFEKDSTWTPKQIPEILYRKPVNNFKKHPYPTLCCNTFFIFALASEWVQHWKSDVPSLHRLQTEEPEVNLYDFFLTAHYTNNNFEFYAPGIDVFPYEYEEVKYALPDYESYRFRFYSTLKKREEKFTSIEVSFIKWIHETYKKNKLKAKFRYKDSTFENYIFQGIVNLNDHAEIQLKYT